MRDTLPGLVITGDGQPAVAVNGTDQGGPPAVLSAGTIIVMRLRSVGSGPHAVRGVEVSLGGALASQHGNSTAVHWSDGALLYTLAPGTLTAPEDWQDMQLPVPQPPRHMAAWTHLRLRYLTCDGWGHALGDVDCDDSGGAPAQDLTLHLLSLALARRSADPPLAALKLVRSTVSLFHFLTEQRYLRLEDLHWQVFDLRGNVRTNFSEVEGNAYADDDLSQFSVDSDDLDTGLHLQLIDLDKILVSHDVELRWYVAEQSMPFVAAQLLSPLAPLLPGLRVAMQRMLDPNVLLRPPSFQCLIDWAADPDAATWMASRAQGDWKDLPCDPAVYNQDVRSRWENPHFGRR